MNRSSLAVRSACGVRGGAHGVALSTRDGTARLVGRLISGLAEFPIDAADDSARFAQYVVGLIALICGDVLETCGAPGRLATLQDAKDYVEAHLADADLTPDRVA